MTTPIIQEERNIIQVQDEQINITVVAGSGGGSGGGSTTLAGLSDVNVEGNAGDALVKKSDGTFGFEPVTGSTGSTDWADITNKPATFTPAAHNQGWETITGKPATFDPSAHSHPISDVSSVQVSNPQDGQALVYDSTTQKWINEAVSGGAASIPYIRHDPDYPPASPSAWDDEFYADTALNTTKWTIYGSPVLPTASIIPDYGLKMEASDYNERWKILAQPATNIGQNFDIITKCAPLGNNYGQNLATAGLFISDGLDTSANFYFFGYRLDTEGRLYFSRGQITNSPPTNILNFTIGHIANPMLYLRLNYNSSTQALHAFYSVNGFVWRQFEGYTTSTTTNVYFGLAMQGQSLNDSFSLFNWFRAIDQGTNPMSRYINPGRVLRP